MRTGTTPSGFEFEILDSAIDNWELLEVLSELDDGKHGNIVKAVKMLLGEDGLKSLKEHCRDENGKVKSSKMHKEISEIFKCINDDGKEPKN